MNLFLFNDKLYLNVWLWVLYNIYEIKFIDWMFNFKKVKNFLFYCISFYFFYFLVRKWWFKGKEFFMGKIFIMLVFFIFKYVIYNVIRWNFVVSVLVLYKWFCSVSIIFC